MAKFLELLLAAPEVKPLLSSEHFSMDGTQLRASASHSSLYRVDGLDDRQLQPRVGNGFGAGLNTGKKGLNGDFFECHWTSGAKSVRRGLTPGYARNGSAGGYTNTWDEGFVSKQCSGTSHPVFE